LIRSKYILTDCIRSFITCKVRISNYKHAINICCKVGYLLDWFVESCTVVDAYHQELVIRI